MESLLRDTRFALRSLRRNPLFAIVAIVTLALGIGATTTVFSVVYGVLLRPLPFPNADRFVQIVQTVQSSSGGEPFRAGLTRNQFVDVQESATTLEAVGTWGWAPRTLTGPTTSVRLNGGSMSAGLFRGLGVQPVLGRTFQPADSEPGADPVVIVSDRTWRTYLGGREDIIDTRIDLSGVPTRVIGVMPAHFTYPSLASSQMSRNSVGELEDVPEFWIPPRRFEREKGDGFTILQAFAILKPSVSIQQAETQVRSVLGPMPKGWTSRLELVSARSEMGQRFNRPLMIFQLGVALILLIACVNVVNLLLARAAGRRRELAIRTALGASRGRILREGIAEVLVLSITGGLCACAIAYGLTTALQLLPPHVLPRLHDIRVDAVVLAFALGISVTSGVAIGLLSAWRASRSSGIDDLHQHALRGSTHSPHARLRPSSILVVTEIAAAVVLVTCAGLLVRSFVKLATVDMGYQPRGLVTFKVSLPAERYRAPEARIGLYDQFAREIRTQPGVMAVASADNSLSGAPIGFYPLTIDGRAVGGRNAEIRYRGVSADYFRTLGVPVLDGREFSRDDRASTATQTVVNEAFARRYLAGDSPVGRQVRWSNWNVQIIGVAGDTRNRREAEREPTLYFPATYGSFFHEVVMFVRTTSEPATVLAAARTVINRIDPQLAVYDGASVEEMLEYSSASPRLYGLVSLVCGAVALALAVIGLYGVLAYSVGSRTHEFGIRMALGAESRTVKWHVLRQGLSLTVVGLIAGLGGSYAAAHGVSSLLFGVTPRDGASFALTASLLVVTTTLACYIPSRRATRVDPVIALRSE